MLGGKAPMALAVMWCLTAITLIFVVLRIYTRAIVVRQLGWDDHIYVISGLFLLLYTTFLHVAASYGFGQAIVDLDLDDAVQAVKWEMVGQTFAVIGMATAKVSLGLFLLRIVMETWHRVVLWVASLSLLVVSIMTAVVFWIQCLPPQSIFDPRVKGRCIIEVTPFSVVLGCKCVDGRLSVIKLTLRCYSVTAWCAAVDFLFAAFPWFFIWQLNMRYMEKITIAASLSLGVVAGVCGVVRTIELSGLASENYTEDTVGLIIWSAAELAVTMICAGIPVLRPLVRHHMGNTTRGSSRSDGYYKHGTGSDGSMLASAVKLDNIPSAQSQRKGKPQNQSDVIESSRGFPDSHPKLGIRGPTTVSYIMRSHNSEDSGLREDIEREAKGEASPRGTSGIQVRERVDVSVEQAVNL
ncbi:hypothetical protein B0T17DRAFT_239334 [Bombardia bombarda]|uniref:Rhodopsin domain-containing protein n=1 Tax=Bombardia bombarda TaxID=252184 RepID=A0AA39XBW8_9PEZI|nr:hypothetical protein B0T17DRAFT_239334 [Bombardia bombarda]